MDAKPSKSAKKREVQALQALGERLVALPDTELATIPLDDDLREAVQLARRIKSHGALRRQRQLIGKLMRRVDAEPIRQAIAAIDRGHAGDTHLLHEAERWRDRLVQDGRSALDAFTEVTGNRNQELAELLDALPRSPTAALERRHRRDIFRQVLADLSTKMQSGSR